jgi:hypothetical protein
MNPFECPICTNHYTDDIGDYIPKVLPCGHTFCTMCLFSLFHTSSSSTILICPQCRFHHPVLSYDSLPKNYTVIEFIYYFKKYRLKHFPFSSANPNQIHLQEQLRLLEGNGNGNGEESEIEREEGGGEEEEKEISTPCIDGEIFSFDEMTIQRKPLEDLSIIEVSNLLTHLKLSKFVEIFLENDIDGLTLSHCQAEEDLVEAGIYIKVKARFLFEKIQIYQSLGVPVADLQPPSHVLLADELLTVEEDVSIWITGMTGIYEFMNGMYYPTEEVFMGRRRYFKLQHDCWIEYNSDCQQWHIKPKDKKTTTNAWAYLPSSPSTRYPYDSPSPISNSSSSDPSSSSSWYLFDGSVFNKNDDVYCFPHYSIHFAGIPIDESIPSLPPTLNGSYEPVPHDIFGGICRYRQRSFGYSSPTRYWIEYSPSTKQWQLKRDIDLGTNNFLLYIRCSNPKDLWSNIFQWVVSPELLPSLPSSFDPLSSSLPPPLISPDILSFPKLYSLEISGGTGPTATHIRGVYQPSHEIFGGWVRYQKITDTNCWLEKMDCQKQWHVKPSKDKCLTNAWACTKYVHNGPPYLAQNGWLVYDGSAFHLDPELKCTKKLPLI